MFSSIENAPGEVRGGQKINGKLSWVSRPFMVNSDSPCSFLISELENIPRASSATPFSSKHLYAFSKNSSVRYEVFPQDRNLGFSSKPLTLAYVITLTKALTTRSLVYCDCYPSTEQLCFIVSLCSFPSSDLFCNCQTRGERGAHNAVS